MYDLFICYSSKDREEVRPIAEAFQAAGLKVWWDRQILPDHLWGKEIEKALADSRRVLAFISPNVAASENYFVAVEIKRAHELKKLVPVKIGEFSIPYDIEGFVYGRQMFMVGDFASFRDGQPLRDVCRLLAPEAEMPARLGEPAVETVADWFDKGPPLPQMALAIAIAVAESSPLSVVTDMAQRLEAGLKARQGGSTENAPPADLFQSRSRNLERVRALQFSVQHRRLLVDISCVRFKDPEWAAQMLDYVWSEFDDIRATLIDWLDHYARTGTRELRLRIGLTLGTLARRHLGSIQQHLLRRWLHEDHAPTRDIADIALSFVAFEPALRPAVVEFVRDLAARRGRDNMRAAVELACGYTGSRLDGLPTETLKRVTKRVAEAIDAEEFTRGDFTVLMSIEAAFDFMMGARADSEDDSLFDLRKLVAEIAEWAEAEPAEDDDEGEEARRMPIALFLALMNRMPLYAPEGVTRSLSLKTLMSAEGSDAGTREATARIFEAALRDFGFQGFKPRDMAQAVLRKWQESDDWVEGDDDPLLALARNIHSLCADEHDRSRLLFAMRRRYQPHQIATPYPTISIAPGKSLPPNSDQFR